MADETTGMDMSKLLENLMADERFGEVLNAVKESFSTSADNPPKTESDGSAPNEAPVPAIPTMSPELMAKLPEIMGMLNLGKDGKRDSAMADRKRLLTALKPFLSENRKNAVDSIVNIAGIADLFGI